MKEYNKTKGNTPTTTTPKTKSSNASSKRPATSSPLATSSDGPKKKIAKKNAADAKDDDGGKDPAKVVNKELKTLDNTTTATEAVVTTDQQDQSSVSVAVGGAAGAAKTDNDNSETETDSTLLKKEDESLVRATEPSKTSEDAFSSPETSAERTIVAKDGDGDEDSFIQPSLEEDMEMSEAIGSLNEEW